MFTSSGESLLQIINDILDISKIEAGQLTLEKSTFDLHKSVDETVQLFSLTAMDKDINLILIMDDDVPNLVQGDPTRIRQVLLNLIGNAVKFISSGSVKVHISCCNEDNISFSVSDTGPGIPESKQNEIFHPFTQADTSTTRTHGGTGLGLTICQRLVDFMGGSLQLESKVGQGSTFTFKIPLTEETETSEKQIDNNNDNFNTPTIESSQSELDTNLSILLIEDAEENQIVIQGFLRKTGSRIEIAENGLEGVQKFKGGHFDCVLMDIQMPVMDGYEATRKIREIEQSSSLQRTPIIALTAHALQDEAERIKSVGCDMHLTKPIRKKRLLDILGRYTKKSKTDFIIAQQDQQNTREHLDP